MFKLRSLLLLSSFALVASAFASLDITLNSSDATRTLFNDPSGYSFGSQGWGAFFDNSGADLFLNDIEVVQGAGFDPNIQLSVPTGSGGFVAGTSIASGGFLNLFRFLNLDANSGQNAALGTYDFAVNFRGGDTVAANDILNTLDLHVEVFSKLSLTVTGSATVIEPSALTSNVTMTVRNDMARDFASTSYFTGGYSLDPNPSGVTHNLSGAFPNNAPWLGATIVPGGSLTGAQSLYTANPTTVPGVYKGFNGVVGGLHNGDFFFVPMDASSNITVRAVPEPASFAVLGLGALGLLRRRRRA